MRAERGSEVTPEIAALSSGARLILDRELTGREASLLGKYLTLLLKWGSTQRLVGRTDPLWIVEELLLDSLLFLRLLPAGVRSVLDLGSGAGLPGIPLKIVLPAVEFTLLESRRRRASFLSTVVRALELGGTRVINDRAEAVAAELASSFDVVVTRCAGALETVAPLAVSFLAAGGVAVASGPPEPRRMAFGDWARMTVQGRQRERAFWIYRRSQ